MKWAWEDLWEPYLEKRREKHFRCRRSMSKTSMSPTMELYSMGAEGAGGWAGRGVLGNATRLQLWKAFAPLRTCDFVRTSGSREAGDV